jgi:hypothetical protein
MVTDFDRCFAVLIAILSCRGPAIFEDSVIVISSNRRFGAQLAILNCQGPAIFEVLAIVTGF